MELRTLCLHLMYLFAVDSMSVFLIGDSVDRFIVHDWCELHGWRENKAKEVDWADRTLEIHEDYRGHRDKIPFLQCIDSRNDSIAMIHIFGSWPQGPYLKMIDRS